MLRASPERFVSTTYHAMEWLRAWSEAGLLDEAKQAMVSALWPEPLVSWMFLSLRQDVPSLRACLLSVCEDPDVAGRHCQSRAELLSVSVVQHVRYLLLNDNDNVPPAFQRHALSFARSQRWTASCIQVDSWRQLHGLGVPTIDAAVVEWIQTRPEAANLNNVVDVQRWLEQFLSFPELHRAAAAVLRSVKPYLSTVRAWMDLAARQQLVGVTAHCVEFLLTSPWGPGTLESPSLNPAEVFDWAFASRDVIQGGDLGLIVARVAENLSYLPPQDVQPFLLRALRQLVDSCAKRPTETNGAVSSNNTGQTGYVVAQWLAESFAALARRGTRDTVTRTVESQLLSVPVELVVALLSTDYDCPDIDEMTLMVLVVTWLEAQPSSQARQQLCATVARHIRFALFSPAQLREILDTHPMFDAAMVATHRLRSGLMLKAPRSPTPQWFTFGASLRVHAANSCVAFDAQHSLLSIASAQLHTHPSSVHVLPFLHGKQQHRLPEHGTYLYLVQQPLISSLFHDTAVVECDRCKRAESQLVRCPACLTFQACGRHCLLRHPEGSCQRRQEKLEPAARAVLALSERMYVGILPSTQRGKWVGSYGLSSNGLVLGKTKQFATGTVVVHPLPFRSDWVGIAANFDDGSLRYFSFGNVDPVTMSPGAWFSEHEQPTFSLFFGVGPSLCWLCKKHLISHEWPCNQEPGCAALYCSLACRVIDGSKGHPAHLTQEQASQSYTMKWIPATRWTGATLSTLHLQNEFTRWIDELQQSEQPAPQLPPALEQQHEPLPPIDYAVLAASTPIIAQRAPQDLSSLLQNFSGVIRTSPKIETTDVLHELLFDELNAEKVCSYFLNQETIKSLTGKQARVGHVGGSFNYPGLMNGTLISYTQGELIVLTLRHAKFPPGHVSCVLVRVQVQTDRMNLVLHQTAVPKAFEADMHKYWREIFFDNWREKLQVRVFEHLSNDPAAAAVPATPQPQTEPPPSDAVPSEGAATSSLAPTASGTETAGGPTLEFCPSVLVEPANDVSLSAIVERFSKSASQPRPIETGSVIEQFTLQVSPLEVYRCFVDTEQIKAVTGKQARFPGQIGMPYNYLGGMITGTLIFAETQRLLVLTLRQPKWPPGHMSLAVVQLDEAGEGSALLTVHQTGVPADFVKTVRLFWRETMLRNWIDKLQFRLVRYRTNEV